MKAPVLREEAGGVVSADPTHGKLDGDGIQTIRDVADICGCNELSALNLCNG